MGLEALEVEARRYKRPWYWLAVLFVAALLFTLLDVSVARTRIAENNAQYRAEQTARLDRAATSMADFLDDAVQLATATAGTLGPIRGDRPLVERLLRSIAPTVTNPVIYGMGVFYAPRYFDSRSVLYGPYAIIKPRVRLDLNSESNFNYPSKRWYTEAVAYSLAHGGKFDIVGPYVEEGVSYISVVQPFYVNGQLAGVTSVDTRTSAFDSVVDAAMGKVPGDVLWVLNGHGGKEYPAGPLILSGNDRLEQSTAIAHSEATLHLSSDASALTSANRKIVWGAVGTGTAVWLVSAIFAFVVVRGWRARERALESEVREARLEHEIAASKKLEAGLRKAAYADALTGLPNRTPFLQAVSEAMDAKNDRRYAIFFIDLDRFNLVNDTLGHLAGDELLKTVAKRLRGDLPPESIVARLGGDEFLVLAALDGKTIEACADSLLTLLRQPVTLRGRALHVAASIGAVGLGSEYSRPDELLRDADIAMYAAKQAGRARFAVFDTAMRMRVTAESELESDLRSGIERSEFRAYYQPIVDVASAEIRSFEALVRWERPGHGLVGAAEFVRFAELRGFIDAIDTLMLRAVCRDAAEFGRRFGPTPIAVNVSATHLTAADLVPTIANLLSSHQLEPRRLEIEITETAVMSNEALARSTLEGLRELGVAVVLDDFGQGHSSLAYLQRLPIAGLKIDRSFVEPLATGPQPVAIVRSIVALARTLGLYTVAEGVENLEQLDILRELGVDHAQGFFFSQARSLGEVLAQAVETAG